MQQPTTARIPSGGLLGASIALALVILFLWSVALSTLRHFAGSDAAGNGLAQFYAAAELVLLWIFLAILMIVAGANGAMPTPAIFAAFILIPASGYAALKVVKLLSEPNIAPFLWPLVVPEIVPPLVIAFCFWTPLPPLRAAISARHCCSALNPQRAAPRRDCCPAEHLDRHHRAHCYAWRMGSVLRAQAHSERSAHSLAIADARPSAPNAGL